MVTINESFLNNTLEFKRIKEASLLLRALNNSFRQKILKLLQVYDKLTVTEIFIHLRLEQAIASQHLAVLRRANIVSTTREGKNIYYALNHVRLHDISNFIGSILQDNLQTGKLAN